MPFVIADAPDVPVPVAPAAPTRTDLLRKWAPIPAGGVILLGIVIAMTLRRRRAKRTSTPLVLSATPTTAQLEAAVTPVLASDELRAKAHARALQDPATAALVLRSWLGTALPDAHDGAKP
jgi:hypothetical protein